MVLEARVSLLACVSFMAVEFEEDSAEIEVDCVSCVTCAPSPIESATHATHGGLESRARGLRSRTLGRRRLLGQGGAGPDLLAFVTSLSACTLTHSIRFL